MNKNETSPERVPVEARGGSPTVRAAPGTDRPGERTEDDAATPASAGKPYFLRIGRFHVVRQLGAGAGGAVYSAFDPKLNREVALKVLHSSRQSEPGKARFLREAQAMAKLVHPNIVTVHEVDELAGNVFLCMELVDGTSLQTWLGAARRSTRAILDVFLEAARALQAAHDVGVVHRDFKPTNVLVTATGRAKVIDFGLARLIADDTAGDDGGAGVPAEPGGVHGKTPSPRISRTGALMGTPAYMSPEQLVRAEATPRSDQFSFCVALWEALYGSRPFAGETAEEIHENVRSGRILRPLATRQPPGGMFAGMLREGEVPAWIVAILRRGLSVRPEARFPSMSALLQTLEQGRIRLRNKRVILGVGMLVLAAVGLLGWRQYERKERVRACEAAGNAIDSVWNDEFQIKMRESFIATRVPHAEASFERVRPWVDQFVTSWRAGRREACLAGTVDRTLAPAAHSRAVLCFNESIAQFRMLVQIGLSQRVRQVPENAVYFVSRLPPPDRCLDETALARQAPFPEAPNSLLEVISLGEQAHFLDLLAIGKRFPQAQALGRHIIGRADVLGYQPLRARVLMTFAQIDGIQGHLYQARDRFEEAYFVAARAGADNLAAEIASALVYVLAEELHDSPTALLWGALGQVALDRFGADERLRVHLLNHIGLAHFAARDYEHAREFHVHALELAERHLGAENPAIAMMLNNLAKVHAQLRDFDTALDYLYSALDLRVRAQGPEHPEVGKLLSNITGTYWRAERYEEAIEAGEEALAHRRRGLGATHPDVGKTLYNLGRAYAGAGEHARAMDAFREALDILESKYEPDNFHVLMAKCGLARELLYIGAYAEARQRFAWVRARSDDLQDPPHELIMSALIGEAQATIELHSDGEDVRTLERVFARALKVNGQIDKELTAEAQFMLAQLLWPTKAERTRALHLAIEARDVCRVDRGGGCAMLDAIESWLEGRG